MQPPRKTLSKKLLGKQPHILATIAQSILEKGHPPTEKELCHSLHMTHSAMHRSVDRLIQLGYLKRTAPLGTLRVRLP